MTLSRALARSPMGADTRKFANLELGGLKRDGTFSGYASIFGEVDKAACHIDFRAPEYTCGDSSELF